MIGHELSQLVRETVLKVVAVFRFQGSKEVVSNEYYLGILIGNGAIHIIYG